MFISKINAIVEKKTVIETGVIEFKNCLSVFDSLKEQTYSFVQWYVLNKSTIWTLILQDK